MLSRSELTFVLVISEPPWLDPSPLPSFPIIEPPSTPIVPSFPSQNFDITQRSAPLSPLFFLRKVDRTDKHTHSVLGGKSLPRPRESPTPGGKQQWSRPVPRRKQQRPRPIPRGKQQWPRPVRRGGSSSGHALSPEGKQQLPRPEPRGEAAVAAPRPPEGSSSGRAP